MAFLFAGMVVFWITTFIFVISVLRRERKLEEEVSVLRQSIEDAPPQ